MAGSKYYGQFGGQYVSESLMNTLAELEKAFDEAINDPQFIKDYMYYLKEYVGRETPLYYAERISEKYGAEIYLKREDLNHTGAHKINNVIGQILLAKRMGKTKVIAETGAGQHGVATATGAALLIWSVQFSWVLRISRDRNLMYSEWKCLELRCDL